MLTRDRSINDTLGAILLVQTLGDLVCTLVLSHLLTCVR
jgi:hypothetical protein